MFGLVAADIGALEKPSVDIYRGAYCGLCTSLSRRHGSASRITLNYEATFLLLLLSSVYDVKFTRNYNRCCVHPTKPQLCLMNELTDYAADMNIALSYQNAMDNWRDEKNAISLAAARAMRGEYRKVYSKYPRQCSAVEKCLAELYSIEKSGDPSPDRAASAFGSLLAEVFIWQEDALSESLRNFGFALGRVIYIMDAAIDLKSDLKHRRYNPLAFVTTDREEILNSLMSKCTGAYELLSVTDYKDIFDNILYLGIWQKYRCRLKKGALSSGKRPV